MSPPGPSTAVQERATAAVAGPGARILVVDDETDLVVTYERLLRRRGYRVATAGSLASGLAALRGEPPDLVITDLRLPDGDGLEIVRAARSGSAAPAVVVITGYASASAREAALAAGAAVCMGKPFSALELGALVERLLGS